MFVTQCSSSTGVIEIARPRQLDTSWRGGDVLGGHTAHIAWVHQSRVAEVVRPKEGRVPATKNAIMF